MGKLKFDVSREYDVIPLGRVTVDFNPIDMNRPLDESTSFRRYLGGSPANIAVGLARLGKKVGFIGKISDDQFGRFVYEYFSKEGIDVSHLTRAKNGESMGLTFTEIKSERESSILMYRTEVADLALTLGDVDEAYIRNAKFLLISGTSLSKCPSRDAALKALQLAKRCGTLVVFDVDYRPYNWYGKEEIAVYYSVVAQQSDMIIGSKEEFDLLDAVLGKSDDDGAIAEEWMNDGNQIVVIKHGKDGANLFTADGGRFTMKPFPVKKLKGFGGGDGFASAFLYGILEGKSIEEALELSNASASLLVSAHSCSDAMPDVAHLTDFLSDCRAKFGASVSPI